MNISILYLISFIIYKTHNNPIIVNNQTREYFQLVTLAYITCFDGSLIFLSQSIFSCILCALKHQGFIITATIL